MAKRFSETKIWDDVWFQELPIVWKCLWWYLFSKCDEAGIWKVNKKLAEFQIGRKIQWDKAFQYLNKDKERIKFYNGFWVIVEFVSFQYGDKVYTSVHPFHEKIRGMLDRVSNTLSDRVKEEEEVKEEVKDKGKEEEYKNIINDLNIVLGTSYQHTTGKTKELIRARLNEGFNVDDFKTVHRKMLKTWGADTRMAKYLRPLTLYSPKFESYLNMKEPTTKLTQAGVRAYIVGQEWLKKEGATNG